MVKSRMKSRRKSKARRKSKVKRKSRKCKHGQLKSPVRDQKTGKMRYCKKAPKVKSVSKRKCKHGKLKKPIRNKETGKMRYCKLKPKVKKSKRKSRRKSRRKSKGRSTKTYITHRGRMTPAVYKQSYAEWLDVSSKLHLANKKERKNAIKTAKITGSIMKLEKELLPLKIELKSLVKNRGNRAVSNAVMAYGEKKVISMLNKGFKETKLREAGITDRMYMSKRSRAKSQ